MKRNRLKLMAILAHPDDESLGMGGTLARCADEGIETYLVCATRGERGRHGSEGPHPGIEMLGRIREAELRSAAGVLGIREVTFLDYVDRDLDQADPGEAIARIVGSIRSVRPDVVVTFGPDGAYGHPDHVAISQFATAAVSAAASGRLGDGGEPHQVSKLYYLAWAPDTWEAYQKAFRKLSVTVDGEERMAVPWPEWSITTRIDTGEYWPTVWKAVCCHQTQLALYEQLGQLSDDDHRGLWGSQEFYRAFSLVNGGRVRESDLFEGLRDAAEARRSQVVSPTDDPPSGDPQEALDDSDGGTTGPGSRRSPLDLPADQFRKLGHALVDQVAEFLGEIRGRKVTTAAEPQELRALLASLGGFPEQASDLNDLLPRVARHLFDHSLHNGHPRFWGYITSSAAPAGMLAEFLASSVNPNVGSATLAPLATEIESETIRWIAELTGYPAECGGILVSGGNMANLVCFLVARRARLGPEVRTRGVGTGADGRPRLYASKTTHTWIEKAADITGLGTDSIRWIPTDSGQRIDLAALERQIERDRAEGDRPFLVVGNAGTVGIGAVDPLTALGGLCRKHGLWFHIDGAYGALAGLAADDAPELLHLAEGDSLAVDPHKWLYAPLEAGCALVRDPLLLRETFSYHPDYYHFDEERVNYFDLGPQNSRGFRALKIWLALRHAGREGYRHMISTDIALADRLAERLRRNPNFQSIQRNLSIVTFRYVPAGRHPDDSGPDNEYVNELNQEILERIERDGEFFLSRAVVDGKTLLRACIVNFRTEESDIDALPEYLVRIGTELDRTS